MAALSRVAAMGAATSGVHVTLAEVFCDRMATRKDRASDDSECAAAETRYSGQWEDSRCGEPLSH
jgi:hypothetical protein